jgi:hypothetical protein
VYATQVYENQRCLTECSEGYIEDPVSSYRNCLARDATFEPVGCGVSHNFYSSSTVEADKFTINNQCGVETNFNFANTFSGIPRIAVGVIYENNKQQTAN